MPRRTCLAYCGAGPEGAPIGGGRTVGGGERCGVCTPELTRQFAKVAEGLGGSDHARATEKATDAPKFRWQRKLMGRKNQRIAAKRNAEIAQSETGEASTPYEPRKLG